MQREDLIATLKAVVGRAQVLTDPRATRPYRTGFRYGGGNALALVRPRSLVELWHALRACIAANTIILPQAANTGLTGGSTPLGNDSDRDVVIINMMHIAKSHILDEGRQVVCLPGTTLYQLEEALEPYDREPHSVIGSSCIGASVIGGICNNSGGALLRRGPAYTQMAVFARLDEERQIRLVNHLGIRLGQNPEEVLRRLERGEFDESEIEYEPTRCGSARDYTRRLRAIDSDSPARFNANPEGLFEASGSAGKIMVFAVRLDTFPKDKETRVFYVGTNDPGEFTTIRRHILSQFANLPVACEYMHRDIFDIAETYGKDTFLIVQNLGTKRLLRIFRLKRALDAFLWRLGLHRLQLSDKLFQCFSRMLPSHLPPRLNAFRNRFEHYLLLKMSGDGISEASSYLHALFPSPAGDYFECTDEEASKAFLHRFVAAGAAVRYRAVHSREVEDIIALDIALKRNDRDWFESLPIDVRSQIHHALYYGHFFCHVFHQDYVVRKGCDTEALEHRLWRLLDARGAEYPAEHNVGHLYAAKPALVAFYRSLDPCNAFNPGIGRTSKSSHWT